MSNVRITKKLVLTKLYDLVQEYEDARANDEDSKVKAADVINALKQISLMKGFLEPTVSRVIQEIEIEF